MFRKIIYIGEFDNQAIYFDIENPNIVGNILFVSF